MTGHRWKGWGALALAVALGTAGCGRPLLLSRDGATDGPAGQPAAGGSNGAGGASADAAPDAGADRTVAPGSPNGAACAAATACASGYCVDGACCATACTGGCDTCAATGSTGTCVHRSAGESPRTNGDCSIAACQGETSVGGSRCDGRGSCAPDPIFVCAPFRCDPATGACRSRCTSDGDCAGVPCVNGTCLKSPDVRCVANNECASGFCADGVCCNTSCTGPCKSCALPASLGTCTNVPNGSADPRDLCFATPPATCGFDGACDGAGSCRRSRAGTVCAAASCTDGLLTPTRTCDGAGTCLPATALPCAPYVCGPSGTCICAPGDNCL